MFYIVFFVLWIVLSIAFFLDDCFYVRDEFVFSGFMSFILMIILAFFVTLFIFVVFKGFYWLFVHRVKFFNAFIKMLIDFKSWIFDV